MLERLNIILPSTEDLVQKEMIQPITRQRLELAFYQPICDEEKIRHSITVPFIKNEYPIIHLFTNDVAFKPVKDPGAWSDLLLNGQVLIEYEKQIFSFDALNYKYNDLPEPKLETSLLGPQHSLSSDPIIALNIIRNSYMTPDLMIDSMKMGTISQTSLYIIYDQLKVNSNTLQLVMDKLASIHTDLIHSSGELKRFLNEKRYRLFPSIIITERIDRIGKALSLGKIVVLLKGSQFALILPASFFDFMHAIEDEYGPFWMTKLLVILRYAALLVTVVLPGLYIATLSHNPEIFRHQLAFSLVASRSVVPYPSFIEVMIMLLMIEMLLEASIRIPRLLGSTSTTVGGLILGSAIQQAGLVSSVMIIVTSLVAISNFVLPVHNMSLAVRFLKYPIIVAAIFLGLTGVMLGVFFYITVLCSTRSFGQYYFRFKPDVSKQQGDTGGATTT